LVFAAILEILFLFSLVDEGLNYGRKECVEMCVDWRDWKEGKFEKKTEKVKTKN